MCLKDIEEKERKRERKRERRESTICVREIEDIK